MHPSFMTLGDPFPDGPHFEIINSQRAFHYATEAGITWLLDCNVCPAIDSVVEGVPYTTPDADFAPWYDPNNPDTADFYGIIGLDIIGAESSMRSATVTSALSGGGVVGPTYHGPRTIVIRGLAVAADSCSLAAGVDWLCSQYGKGIEECGGDTLTYFDCCPCLCTNPQGELACWAQSYAEILDGPTCEHDWWPTTYAELKAGPPITSETWCSWPQIYRQLLEGPPAWSCCVDQCVAPYFRQLRKARITSGPIILDTPALKSCGAMALIEFTIVAADPHEHAPLARSALMTSEGAGVALAIPVPQPAPVSRFYIPRPSRTALLDAPVVVDETEWMREQTVFTDMSAAKLSGGTTHLIRLTPIETDTQAIRLGLWSAGSLVTGYWLPYLPVGALVTIDEQGRDVTATYTDGTVESLRSFVRSYDTASPTKWVNGPAGEGVLTVDRVAGDTSQVLVELMIASVAA